MRRFLKFAITIWVLMMVISALPQFSSKFFMLQTEPNMIWSVETELLKNFMKNERVQIVFESGDDTKSFGFIIQNGEVVESKVGVIENPTVIIRCSSSLGNKIINSKDEISAIVDAILSDELIEVKSKNPILFGIFEITKFIKKIINFMSLFR